MSLSTKTSRTHMKMTLPYIRIYILYKCIFTFFHNAISPQYLWTDIFLDLREALDSQCTRAESYHFDCRPFFYVAEMYTFSTALSHMKYVCSGRGDTDSRWYGSMVSLARLRQHFRIVIVTLHIWLAASEWVRGQSKQAAENVGKNIRVIFANIWLSHRSVPFCTLTHELNSICTQHLMYESSPETNQMAWQLINKFIAILSTIFVSDVSCRSTLFSLSFSSHITVIIIFLVPHGPFQ